MPPSQVPPQPQQIERPCRTNVRADLRARSGSATRPIEANVPAARAPSLTQVILSDVSDASEIPHKTDDLVFGGPIFHGANKVEGLVDRMVRGASSPLERMEMPWSSCSFVLAPSRHVGSGRLSGELTLGVGCNEMVVDCFCQRGILDDQAVGGHTQVVE